jgi:hypothetical protein
MIRSSELVELGGKGERYEKRFGFHYKIEISQRSRADPETQAGIKGGAIEIYEP